MIKDKLQPILLLGLVGGGIYLLARKAEAVPPEEPPEEPTPPVKKANFYMPSIMDVKVTDGLIISQYWKCEFSVTITNTGDAPGSFSASGIDNLGRTSGVSGYLEPGQSKTWSVWYHIDFRRMGPYVWELTGNWEGDNYSRGEARSDMAVIAPAISIGAITWDRSPPDFAPGSTHIASVTMKNPTTRAWDYNGALLMGTNEVVMAEVSFHLNSGESKEISFSVVMPTVEGSYPIYLDVSSGGQLLAHQAAGSVTLTYSWQFSGGLIGRCARRFGDGRCYYANIDYSISGGAPNFKWKLYYWDYSYSNTYSKSGNGPASGSIYCSGGAKLYAHPDPNAYMNVEWIEDGMIAHGNFKLVASIAVGNL